MKPENIANIRRGQEATIKLSAYDYTIYGTLKARVGFISADTFKDERSRAADGDPHYKVTLKVDMNSLTNRQEGIEIRPGMQASVELHTGQKTVLQYLLNQQMLLQVQPSKTQPSDETCLSFLHGMLGQRCKFLT